MNATNDPARWLDVQPQPEGPSGDGPGDVDAAGAADATAAPQMLWTMLEAEAGAEAGRAEHEADPQRLLAVLGAVASEVGRPELLEAWHASNASAAASGSASGGETATVGGAGGGLAGVGLKLVVALAVVGAAALYGYERNAPRADAPHPAAIPAPSEGPPSALSALSPAAPAPATVPTQPPAPAEPAAADSRRGTSADPPDAPDSAGAAAERDGDRPGNEPGVRRAGRPGLRPHAPELEDANPVAELPLLEQAQRALRDDPAEALSNAEVHARRFPRGQFAQEREMIAIEALLSLGQDTRARRRGRRFMRRFPASSHVPRLKQLLASAQPPLR